MWRVLGAGWGTGGELGPLFVPWLARFEGERCVMYQSGLGMCLETRSIAPATICCLFTLVLCCQPVNGPSWAGAERRSKTDIRFQHETHRPTLKVHSDRVPRSPQSRYTLWRAEATTT